MARTKKIKMETLYFPKRLSDKLEFFKVYPVTLIEAPSGFGKTTALKHLFDNKVSDTIPVYWHTFLDENFQVAWNSFCKIIGQFDIVSSEKLLAILSTDEETMKFASEIFKTLKCTEKTYLILDDFWKFKAFDLGYFVKELATHQCENLHIIIATQPLSRQAHEHIIQSHNLYMLTDIDFAFSKEDINAYYMQAGTTLTVTQLERLFNITEGWIMAIYLQLLSFLKTETFESGGMDKLLQKSIWGRLSEKEQGFFLHLSIFPTFSLSQAMALSGMSEKDTESLLREKRVFIHFDRETKQFYLHSLFANFLTERFALLSETKQKSIYLIGGELAEKNADRMKSFAFYYKAEAYEKIFALQLTSYDIADTLDEATTPMILDLLEKTPLDIKVKYPKAMIPIAFSLFFVNEHEKLMMIEEEVHEIINQSTLTETEKNALHGEMELLLSFLQYNSIDKMSERHKVALTLLDGPAKLINTKSTWAFGSPSVLFLYWRESGKLAEELEQMDECMPIYNKLTKGHGNGAHIQMRAEAEYMRGNFDESEILCHRAMLKANSTRQNSIYQCGAFLLTQIGMMRGDKALFADGTQTLKERSAYDIEDLSRYTLDLTNGFLNILIEDNTPVPFWLLDSDLYSKNLVIMAQPFAHIIHGRVMINNGEYQKLLGFSEMFMGIASIFPNLLPQLYCKIYMAQAYLNLGKEKDAVATIREALNMALVDEIYMPFVENFKGIKKLLPLVEHEFDCAKINMIRSLAEQLEKGIEKLKKEKSILSPREQDVFDLVKKGLSNKEIAESLFLSEGRTRNVVTQLLVKTNTRSRLELRKL